MFKKSKIENPLVTVSICKEVLETIFDECDKYDIDETGGRIIGYYKSKGAILDLNVCGLIGPGPSARRSRTSFYQDGDYQESIFRKVEAKNPEIEHLGNWHTHHVNGLTTLSSGDLATYERIVNHEKHNTDFFYALLVVGKNHQSRKGSRYEVKHFLFRRGQPSAYEIPSHQVQIVNESPVFIDNEKIVEERSLSETPLQNPQSLNEIRSKDKEILLVMYPNLKPFFSKRTKSLYWKGKLSLIDDTLVELLALETVEDNSPSYSVTLAGSDANRFQSRNLYLNRNFDSSWKAISSFERDLNREIFEALRNGGTSNIKRD